MSAADDYTHLSGLGGDHFFSSRIALRTDNTIAGTHTKSVIPAMMRMVSVSLSMVREQGIEAVYRMLINRT